MCLNRGQKNMKQELLGLIEKKDLIRALAREDSGNGLIPISFKI